MERSDTKTSRGTVETFMPIVRKPNGANVTHQLVPVKDAVTFLADNGGLPSDTYIQLSEQGKSDEEIGNYANTMAQLARTSIEASEALGAMLLGRIDKVRKKFDGTAPIPALAPTTEECNRMDFCQAVLEGILVEQLK